MPDGATIAIFGAIFYGVIGFLAYMLMDEILNFDDDASFMLALFWPLTLAFWLCIGWPVYLVIMFFQAFRSIVNRVLRVKKVKRAREVK